ncbi:FGGY family carbohydrate kinase [Brevibacterium marinum]|uniref:Sugar (Pentulose or hexulose) kinase n=1 Tax=Brevibacterium marinum TaxID=418643 RepID=A0A846RSH7_9MICO|nr:FGGY family carbohydrate kinase [Brevibacterium marinum]NJC57014.1 sugar (pentulose or hexulose) kinase [Brevibacterium marinum]
MKTQAVLGIDAGTTAVKSVVLSTTGTVLGSARAELSVQRATHTYAEQDMIDVWESVCRTAIAALNQAASAEVIAVSVTGQGDGAWLVDANGRPTGPALLWLDGRASDRVDKWQLDGRADSVRRITGSALFPGALQVLLEEIETTEPEKIEASAHHLNCKDWIRFRLTGDIATDPTEASRTYLDVGTGNYSGDLIKELGHERFQRLLPPIKPSTDIAGTVTAEAAAATGLPVGLPVVTGMVDTPLGGIGLGTAKPGQAYAIMGTTSFVGAIHDHRIAAYHQPVITLSFDGKGKVLECFAPMNGTPNLDWARTVLGLADLDWDDIEALAHTALPGAGGVIYLPYTSTSGERAPFVAPAASASWMNLSVSTTVAEMIRAVYEGLAQSLCECMDELGIGSSSVVRLSGGGARSDTICQVLADVSGRAIERSDDAELGARGCAALALVATGTVESIDVAMNVLSMPVRRFEPDDDLYKFYSTQATTFRQVRDALRPQWPGLRQLRADSHRQVTAPAPSI